MSEFGLIRRHFQRPAPAGLLGVGDDCALIPGGSSAWAISTDLLLEGRHFFADVEPESLGHKALAVNLSDLAAMGAAPRACTLGLALPRADDAWLAAFARGFHALADQWGCPLVGGDTTRSDHGLTLSVTVFGAVSAPRALRRDAARPGDDVWVSGTLGDADIALRLLLAHPDRRAAAAITTDPAPSDATPLFHGTGLDAWLQALPTAAAARLLADTRLRLERPEPRVGLGQALVGVAHAAIDVSDGLLQDLGHILAASGCAASLQADALPLSPALAALPAGAARCAALGGGDAYELCFTAPRAHRDAVARATQRAGVPATRIGSIVAGVPTTTVLDAHGQPLSGLPRGFDHFS